MSHIDGQWESEEQKRLHDMNVQNEERRDENFELAGLELADHYKELKEENKETSLEMITPLVEETRQVVSENMKVFGSSQLVQLMVSN